MKLKIYTLTTFCLFFMIKINAQDMYSFAEVENQIDLTLTIEDGPSGQTFELLTEDNHNIDYRHDFINYNISLEYKSDLHSDGFFWLSCYFLPIGSNAPITLPDPLLGATAPVIIPPVRKKKGEVSKLFSSNDYPHVAKVVYYMRPTVYQVTIELLRYKTRQDYLEGNEDNSVHFKKIIFVNAAHPAPSGRNAAVTTYPNPSVNYLTIEFTENGTENPSAPTMPLQVAIFNDKGLKVSEHSLTNFTKNANKTRYNLDTSNLPKGMYFCTIQQGTFTQVKTIIKE
ncbi:T9SS type A sorting domain-containing protein [Kordia sp.]|uniref:T9SS type A sorting domain-containing protein n=1 Tax=Kordia sp. TaxID=1965332 RepID=UPI003D2E9C2D